MKRHFLLLLLVVALSACKEDHSTIKGTWIGTASVQPYPEFIRLDYDSIPFVRLFYNEVAQETVVDFDGKTVSFPLDNVNKLGFFEGDLEKDTIKGKFLLDNKEVYECNLVRVQKMGLGQVGQLVGYYQLEPNHIIRILPYQLGGDITAISITDFSTGKFRIAFPKQENYFSAGPKLLTPYPEELSFEVLGSNGNQVPGIKFRDGEKVHKAVRMEDLTDYDDFEVENGNVKLSCTISYPNSEEGENAKFPLVIHVPRAGEIVRADIFNNHIQTLPFNGVAVLTYDKRGSGASTGNLRESTFEDFASDVEAIIEAAKQNPKIDANKIGLVGYDQAGFVMPIVLSKRNDIKFMVSLAGSAMSTEAQEYLACEQRMAQDGLDAVQINEALNYQKSMFAFLSGKLDSADFQSFSDVAKSKPWRSYVTIFDDKKYINQWRRIYDFDPVSYLEKVKVPMFIAYAGQDVITPPKYNFPIIKKVFEKNPNLQHQLIVYNDANHLFMLGETRGDIQQTEIIGYAPNLFSNTTQWILKQFQM